MNVCDVVRVLGASVTMAGALLGLPVDVPSAFADPCADSEVVFAGGSGEPGGLGVVGQAFVDAIKSQVPARSVGIYPVNYPASHDYRNSALAGAEDTSTHIQTMVANCPNTKLVLSGYSQGASVIEMSTDSLPPQVADHVAAVALFGTPTSTYAGTLMGNPLPVLAPSYRPKSIDLCVPEDIICAEGGNMAAHLMYVQTGMPDKAAQFAASRL
jgi:cutinase